MGKTHLNPALEQMLKRVPQASDTERSQALREVLQEVALAGLVRRGFFGKAYAFRGRDAPAQDCTPDGPSLSDQAAVLCLAELRAPAAVTASPHRGDGQSRPAPGTARHRGPVA